MSDIPASPRAAVQPGPDQSGPPSPAAFLSRHCHKILALAPLAFLIWVVAQYAVDVPFWDQWEFVPLLEKSYHGQLTFPDLWAQHNEHRILFPKIIMLVLAHLTGWNIRCELAVNIILALGIFAVFIHQVKITGRKLGIAGLPRAIPAISLIVFSISQYQNWLWGWQLTMFLNLLAVVGGIVLLAGEPFRWSQFTAAALLGIVATFSFANGVLFWPIGLVILLFVTTGARQRIAAITGWGLLSVLTVGACFYHYQKPEAHPSLGLIFKMPVEYASFVFKYIGGFCAQYVGGSNDADGDFALVFGLAAIGALGWAGRTLMRKRIVDARTLLPYFAMSLYSFGGALMTGVGRVGFGSNQAIYSRYCTMAAPLWVSLVVLLFLLRQGEDKTSKNNSAADGRREKPAHRGGKTIADGLLIAAITVLLLGSVCAVDGVKDFSRLRASGRTSLLNLAANPGAEIDYAGLSLICHSPEVVVERYPFLMKHRLSLFQNWKAPSTPQ